jgi:LysM repeat protein
MLLVLMLSGTVAMSAVAADPLVHTVKWGETLGWIAWRYKVTVADIMDANGLTNANYIYAGQKLTIPGDFSEEILYVVQPGDTLLSIAAKFNVSVWDIARRNGIWNINLIFSGRTLIIPGAANGADLPPAPPADEVPVMQEAIIISAPVMNQAISSPVTVTGWGSGFENNLAVDILDENGMVIGQGYATVDAEIGQIGPFTGEITFTMPAASQPGRVSVYSVSPRDGAVEHLASVSVVLQP